MGRHGKYPFTLADGRTVRGSFKIRGRLFKVQFPHPTETGKYIEAATGVEVPSGFKRKKDPPADWFRESAKLIAEKYSPEGDPQTASWDVVLGEFANEGLRLRTLTTYLSTVRTFRQYVPTSKGPNDVTPEIAKAFTRRYQQDGYTKSKKSDATSYPRAAKTVDNQVRRLSGLWVKLMPKFVQSNPWEHVKRPTLPKTDPIAPPESTVQEFYAWLMGRYPRWELLHAFIEVKSVAVCRLMDLCSLKASQFNHAAATLTISPENDKTHRERIIPLDAKLAAKLARACGEVYLWEKFLPESKVFRPSAKTKYRTQFTPGLLYNAMLNIFAESPVKLRSHDLRRRGVTLTTIACGGNVDVAAQALGLHPATARKHYLDAQRAFDGSEVLKRMASILNPSSVPESSQKKETNGVSLAMPGELSTVGEARVSPAK